jgi:ABC-2 type transport system ATP-binding protein
MPMTKALAKSKSGATDIFVKLEDVGLRYRLLTARETTLKGRVLSALSFKRPSRTEFWALRNVSVEWRTGEVVGLVGPNGSGKSTLLRVVAGILDPTVGRCVTNGSIAPILDINSSLNPNLTARQNVLLYGALNRVRRAEMEERIEKIREFSELGPFFDVPVKTYSSGMLARLGFSTATELRPQILLLDEVLSVGDEHFQRKSYFRMMKLIERGSLVVVVSHNLSFLEGICSRVVFLLEGEVRGDGRPAEIIEKYRRVAS